MDFADTVRASIRGIYCLSPYCWLDTLLKRRESRYPVATNEQKHWRNVRLQLTLYCLLVLSGDCPVPAITPATFLGVPPAVTQNTRHSE